MNNCPICQSEAARETSAAVVFRCGSAYSKRRGTEMISATAACIDQLNKRPFAELFKPASDGSTK